MKRLLIILFLCVLLAHLLAIGVVKIYEPIAKSIRIELTNNENANRTIEMTGADIIIYIMSLSSIFFF